MGGFGGRVNWMKFCVASANVVSRRLSRPRYLRAFGNSGGTTASRNLEVAKQSLPRAEQKVATTSPPKAPVWLLPAAHKKGQGALRTPRFVCRI